MPFIKKIKWKHILCLYWEDMTMTSLKVFAHICSTFPLQTSGEDFFPLSLKDNVHYLFG